MTITILTIIDDIILLIGELVFVDFCKCLISVVSSYQVSQTEGVTIAALGTLPMIIGKIQCNYRNNISNSYMDY